MSRIDNQIVNDIRMLSLDMMKETNSGDSNLVWGTSGLFYELFVNHLVFDKENKTFCNQDRLFVSNKLLPIYYATLNMVTKELSLDNLREYKKLHSNTPGFITNSNVNGDIVGYGLGVSIGERYLESLIKKEIPKCEIINFKAYTICTYNELLSGISLEALQYIAKEKINNYIIVSIIDHETFTGKDVLNDLLEDLDFDVYRAKSNNLSSIDDALNNARNSKNPSIVLVEYKKEKDNKYDSILTDEEIEELRKKYKLTDAFEIQIADYEDVSKILEKRLEKYLSKWHSSRKQYDNSVLTDIINLLENKEFNVDFNAENLKINDNYEEDLGIGNNKIFNIFASKSPFILSASLSNELTINNSQIMDNKKPLNKNIGFDNYVLLNGSVTCSLASLGFKVFNHLPLIYCNMVKTFIKYAAYKELDLHYIFTNDTFLNTYDDLGIGGLDEINSLRLIPKLINFRPCDINEIIGVYDILKNYKKCSTTIIGNGKVKKLLGTNPKYVLAGAYRVEREKGAASGVLIATGSEVALALRIAEELLPYDIDLRVVSMPSQELFDTQTERYKFALLPQELKTFVLEFGSTSLWSKYATNSDYILGIDRYTTSGTKEELLSYYNLDLDSLKTRIIELMKN
jgi:transketolase